MAKTNIVYPVIIKKDGDDYLVYIPDFDGMTQGASLANAIEMARDYIGLACLEFDDRKEKLPQMSTTEQAKALAKEKADDEDFVFSDGEVTYVDLNLSKYKAQIRNQSVKKNCTIPQWLCEEAEEAGINFSKVLQDGLISILGAKGRSI